MSWGEVYLTLQGIYQKDSGLRRGFNLVHRSLVQKPIDIMQEWPLPFDETKEDRARKFLSDQQKLQYEQLKQISIKNATARA